MQFRIPNSSDLLDNPFNTNGNTDFALLPVCCITFCEIITLTLFNVLRLSCITSDFIHSFIHQCLYRTLLGPGLFFSFVIFFTQSVGLLGREISPSQGRYLHTGQHKHRINAHINIHALILIRTHDPRVRASEDASCLRPRGHCDWRVYLVSHQIS
jgi:hypothetical protein